MRRDRAAAAPDLGQPRLDEVVAVVRGQLADSSMARRNRLRAWESWLEATAQRFECDEAGWRARTDALRQQRSAVLRQRRQSRADRAIALRGQLQRARVQLSYSVRNLCASARSELQSDITGMTRQRMVGFEAATRGRVDEVVAEVSECAASQLADAARALGLPVEMPAPEGRPEVAVWAPPLKSRRLETRLMMLLGGGFGLGVSLTLSRLVAVLAPGLSIPGVVACVAIGLAVTGWVVNSRGLLHDRAVLDRWVGEVTASLRLVAEHLVASRVLIAESTLNRALSAFDEAENARVANRVRVLDSELREHATAAARAAAQRDRETPSVLAALDAVRAELAEPVVPRPAA